MRLIKNLAVIITILVAAASCKKENPGAPPVPATEKKIMQVENVYTNGTSRLMKFDYDIAGRIVKADEGDDIITYVYTGDKMAITEFRQSKNAVVGEITATMNASGRIYKQTGNYNYTTNPYTSELEVDYDNNGYVTKASITRNNGTNDMYEYTISNGNVMKIKHTSNGQEVYTDSFEYYMDKKDRSNIQHPYFTSYAIQQEFGLFSINLVKNRKTTRPGTTDVSINSYTYETDAEGYIVKANVITPGFSYTQNYSWQ